MEYVKRHVSEIQKVESILKFYLFIDKHYIGYLNLALNEFMLNILSTSNTSSSFSNSVGEVNFCGY